ncbi:MAG: T9SS type A sorting domain-containing protein [Bacteroidetes bacterium]|nr:T9SS type A sorting domain-containing protein [Bacteroidota bacterium]
MKKISTLFESFYNKASLIKGLVIVFLFSSLFFVGCYEWRNIIQPDSATINSYFDVFVSAQDDGNPDNDWTNEDLVDYGLFGVMLPDGWTVQDSIPFTIVCTNPEYTNSGVLLYSASRSQTLEDSIPSPAGYYWWGAATSAEASMVFFDSLSFSPRIYTGSQPGDYFLRYAIGDVDYWDRNPADDISDPIPITLIDNTGVDELLSNSNVSLYPNPAANMLNIKFEDYSSELIEMQIIDVTGKVVVSEQLTNNHSVTSLEGLSEGVYFVKLTNGQTSQSHKILVK